MGRQLTPPEALWRHNWTYFGKKSFHAEGTSVGSQEVQTSLL
nr:unnamed protein product [Callosobruchus analis]